MSENVSIKVEGLGKRYVIGHSGPSDTLRDALGTGLRGVWKALRQRRLQREEFWALRNLDFSISAGEVVGVVGRNGAGKSTLLKLLSRITEPTEGRITSHGRIASLLEVGTGFHPELNGRENIFLNGAILGMTRAEIKRKFDDIVAFAEVERFLDTPVKRYSSGMYVRLAFAVAAHLEPEILIVDEVLAVGDAQFQQKCLGKMQSIADEQGRTILFVSHNLRAIEHLCHRGLLLDRGSLVFDDSARVVAAEYLARGNQRTGRSETVALGEEIDLLGVQPPPTAVDTRHPLELRVDLAVKLDCQLLDLHLYLVDSHDERVALLDLRDRTAPSGTREFLAGQRVQFVLRIAQLHLTDGSYRVGLFVRTARHIRAYDDLADLQVRTDSLTPNLMPYAPEYLGSTVIDFDLDTEMRPKA